MVDPAVKESSKMVVDEKWTLLLLNQRRHDLLNSLQIALGYLALGKIEEAKASLLRLAEELKQEHHLSRMGDLSFILYLTFYPVFYPRIDFSVEMIDPITLPDSFVEQDGGKLVRRLLQWIGEHHMEAGTGSISLLFRIEKGEQGLPAFTIDYVGGLSHETNQEAFCSLLEELERSFRVTEMERSKDEWVMKLIWTGKGIKRA